MTTPKYVRDALDRIDLMTVPVDVRTALDRLGGTSDAVADTLRAKGVRGVRNYYADCPVAVWLRGEFPGAPIEVGVGYVFIDGAEVVMMPEPVRDFVHDFDVAGWHADLEVRP